MSLPIAVIGLTALIAIWLGPETTQYRPHNE